MSNFWDQFETADTNTENTSDNNFWNQFSGEDVNSSMGDFGETYIYAAPKKNLLTDFRDCLNWVNRTRLAAYQEGKNQVETASLEMKDMVGLISDSEKNRLAQLNNEGSKTYGDYGIVENNFADDNAQTKIANIPNAAKKGYIEAFKMLPYMWETIKAGGIGTVVGTGAGAVIGAGTGLATTKANTPQLALQGAKIGGAWGGRISGSMKLAELEGGLARNELKQINQEIIEKGGEALSDAEINTLALSVGGVNAGLEMVSLKQMLKTVPGGDSILNYLEKKSLKELATNKTVREQLRGVLAQYGKTIATEVSTEMLQETTNIVADEMAKSLGGVENTPLEQNVARVIDTGKATFGATLFLGGATSAAKATTILAKQGMTRVQAENAVKKMTPEEINEVVENNLDTLFKTVDDIPTVKEVENTAKLKNSYFTQARNAGLAEDEADANATVMSEAFASLAKATGENLQDIEKEANIVIQRLTEEDALKQYQKDSGFVPEPHFQAAEIAGAKETNIANAQKEWQEKGTESTYFKNWFGDSKVVNENGKPLVVYHGAKNAMFSEFDSNLSNYGEISKGFNFFTNKEKTYPNSAQDYADRNGGKAGFVFDVYLKIQKPLHIKYSGKDYFTPINYYDSNYKEIKEQFNNGDYDGIIIENTDKNIDDSVLYAVKDSEQIKSVGNRGTFDAKNPNIYFQPDVAPEDDINQRTDKTKYLTDNEVKQLEKDKENFQTYVDKLIKGELSYRTQLRVLEKLTSPYNKIPELKGKKVVITQDVYKKIIDLPNKFEKNHNIDRKRAIKLPQLIADPLYILKSNSEGNEHRFVIVTSSRGNMPMQKLSVILNPKNSVAVVSAYDEQINISEEKKAGRVLYDKKMELSKTILTSKARAIDNSNNSITDNTSNFNPDNGIHFQSIDDTESNINNSRGFTYQRYNFDGTRKENFIALLNSKADKSTLMHEFAHVYLITLNNLAQHNDKAKQLLITVNKWLRYNGKEYTDFQHEKFANNFVAYVKTGKAPTYGLKRAFENFKRWLNDVYTKLQIDENVTISPEAKAVFEELLGDITLDKQVEAGKEIIRKAEQNALLRIQEEIFAKNNKIPQNQLTDRQRRYRETAYDILWYALLNSKNDEGRQLVKDRSQLYMLFGNDHKMNSKNKGIMKQAEKLEQFLSELDDPFSSGDGFLPEWGEFFYDPGIEDGFDADLALMALDVIKNKTYLFDPENIFDEITEQDVQKAQYEFDYIVEEYRTAQGDVNKTNAMWAFYDWCDKQHPYIQEDFVNKWETQTNEIDRYQNLSKFAQAKEDLKIYAAKLKGYGDYSMQFAEYARAIIKRLDFLAESDKAKIFDKLKEFNSFSDIVRNLDDVMDYAETLNDVTERKAIADQITKEVKQTIHTWQNGIKKTKYTYPANKLFTRLRELEKMTQEEIQDAYDSIVNEEISPSYVADEVNSEDYYETIEKMFIQYKANGKYYLPTAFLQDLLNRIQDAKFTAKVARDEIDFERKMQQINLIDELGQALDKRKEEIADNKTVKTAGTLNAAGANLNGFLKMLFNDKIKNKFSLDYLYALKDGAVGKDRREFLNMAKTIWGYKGRFSDIQLFSKFVDMTKKEFTINRRYTPDIENGTFRITSEDKETGKTITERTIAARKEGVDNSQWAPEKVELSRMEVLYYYIQAKNDTSYAMLTDEDKGQFDKFEFDELLNNLTDQEKLLGDIMQAAAEKYWDMLNAYHIKKYHTELGKVKNYFPRKSETQEVKVLELFNDFSQPTTTGKFQKQRTAGPGVRIAPANALAVLFDHMEKANMICIMGEQLDLMNRVFKENNLKNKIEAVWGEKITNEFYNQITGNLFTGQAIMNSMSESFCGKLMNNAIKAAIFFKPQIGIKQIISFMNYGKGDEYVTAQEWMKAFAKQTFSPAEWKKNIEFMMSNEYLRDRFARGGSTDALKRELESRVFSKASLLDEIWSLPVAIGDISAIILGGKPYVDVLMSKGYTKEQAFQIFIETTVNDQQSSIPSTLSNMQRNASKSPLTKMMFAFQNTPWQYYRQCTNAVMAAIQNNDKKSYIKAGKMLFLYGWLFPALFNMVSSLSPLQFAAGGGDDDDVLKDLNPLYTFSSLLTQNPILGELVKALLDAQEGKVYNSQDLFSRYIRSVNKLVRDIYKGKVTPKDVWDATVAFVEPASGVPVGSMGNALSGLYNMAQGDFLKGALKIGGYSDYRAKTIVGED